jgi:hypothetical protein
MSRISPSVIGQPDSLDNVVVRLATAANRSLEAGAHAGRLLVVEAEFTDAAMTFTLPKATGSGNQYKILNNAVLSQDFVVAALGTDVFSGTAVVQGETATATDVFHTTATDDKYTFNNTTTGGLRGDTVEAIDIAAGTWLVRVWANGSGTLATGFAASA